ncbi:hypothetical protein V6N13_024833 [Hibiscus sabdariffa]
MFTERLDVARIIIRVASLVIIPESIKENNASDKASLKIAPSWSIRGLIMLAYLLLVDPFEVVPDSFEGLGSGGSCLLELRQNP